MQKHFNSIYKCYDIQNLNITMKMKILFREEVSKRLLKTKDNIKLSNTFPPSAHDFSTTHIIFLLWVFQPPLV